MIHTSTKPKPFTPPWYKEGKGPVFMIRAGGVEERADFEAELSGSYDAKRVSAWELREAFDAGLAVLLADAPDQLAEMRELQASADEMGERNAEAAREALALPEAERAAFLKDRIERLPDDQRQALEEAERIVRRHWPDYRALHQRLARRDEIVPLLAFRTFCSGWSGLEPEVAFVAGLDGLITDAATRAVPAMDMKAAGFHAYRLLYAAGEEGNFARPSSSDKGRETSRSDEPSKGDGS